MKPSLLCSRAALVCLLRHLFAQRQRRRRRKNGHTGWRHIVSCACRDTSGKTSLETFRHVPSSLLSIALSCGCDFSLTVSSGGFSSSAFACSFWSWPTTRLSRPSTRGWGLDSVPATDCIPLCTGWSMDTRGHSSHCLHLTDRPSCQQHQNQRPRRLQQNQRSPEKMQSRRSQKNNPALNPHTSPRYKTRSARSWMTRTAGCPPLRRRTSLVSWP